MLNLVERNMTRAALEQPTPRQRKEAAEAERISALAGQWEALEVEKALRAKEAK